jgi:hypothetical protein
MKFPKAKVKGFLDTSNKQFAATVIYFKGCVKIAELATKITRDEDLKVDFCNSLELVWNLVIDRSRGLMDHHADKYMQDVQDIDTTMQEYVNAANQADTSSTDESEFDNVTPINKNAA